MTAVQGNKTFAAITLFAALALPGLASAQPMPTEVWLQADPQPGNVGEPVTFTATLRADSGTLRGTVEFREGEEVIGSVDLSGLEAGPGIVTAANRHGCAVTASGGVMCWGENNYGQLGDGTTQNRWTPVPVQGLPGPMRAVAAHALHTCALTRAGEVWCWGFNIYGQLGDGSTENRLTPVPVQGLPGPISAIDLGSVHTCALTEAGAAWCWGRNGHGRLGDGTTEDRLTPVPVHGLQSGVRAVAAGDMHSCALGWGGDAWCWGNNWDGKLGDGTTEHRLTPVPVLGLGRQNQAISAFGEHTCALNRHGRAFCWGRNEAGQLGDGSTTNSSLPVPVHGLPGGSLAIAVGHSHSCAINRHQRSFCWGLNTWGQLGDGSLDNSTTPVRARTGRLPTGVLEAGTGHNCLLTPAGGIRCWGLNSHGQLGDGTTTDRPLPVNVAGGAFAPADGRGVAELVTDELPRGRRCITAHYLGSDDHAPSVSGERCLRITP